MLVKLKNTVPVGVISNDSKLYNVFIFRNGLKVTFNPNESEKTLEINMLFPTLETFNDLKFSVDEHASVQINDTGDMGSIIVTAEDGTQSTYTYTITRSQPYTGQFPFVSSIQSNSGEYDALVSEIAKELHGDKSINVQTAVFFSDTNIEIDGTNIFFEGQDPSVDVAPNANLLAIDADVANALFSSGHKYYIIGWGDGSGGSDWATYNDVENNFIFLRWDVDATQFEQKETSSVIDLDKVIQVYAWLYTGFALPIIDEDTKNFNNVVGQYLFTEATSTPEIDILLGDEGLQQNALRMSVDFNQADIDSYIPDVTADEALALNIARKDEVFTIDDIKNLAKTISEKILADVSLTDYPFTSEYLKTVVFENPLDYFSPAYDDATKTEMYEELLVNTKVDFSDPRFWLSEMGFLVSKFILLRLEYLRDNFLEFDYKLSQDTIESLYAAVLDLVEVYIKFGEGSDYQLTPDTLKYIQQFPELLRDMHVNDLEFSL